MSTNTKSLAESLNHCKVRQNATAVSLIILCVHQKHKLNLIAVLGA